MTKENIELNEKEIEEARKFFDKEIWPKIKIDLKDMTKREACFACFKMGSDMSDELMEEEIEKAGKEVEKMSVEEIKKIIEDGPKRPEDLWEDKTKINGLWVNDKDAGNGKNLEEEK